MAGSDQSQNNEADSNNGSPGNGRNGKHMQVETPNDSTVERSLEDFIARANAAFVDGLDLAEEPVKAEPVKVEPPKPEPVKVEPPRPEPVRVEATPIPVAPAAPMVVAPPAPI